ncbi:MAG TPA: cytochrome c oxidase subunit 2A [Bacillota bacterium]|nr:cytochrome c oxidase subunit 2A [Bacillota bacterium]
MEQHNKTSETSEKREFSLKGTLFSVMFLGGFIIISWFGVYALFLSR